MKICIYTSKGCREINEDYILSKEIAQNISFHIVVDGMGAYSYGEVAAKIVAEKVYSYISNYYKNSEFKTLITQAVLSANGVLAEEIAVRKQKMGVTFAGVLLIDNIAYAFWMGDAKIYQMRGSEFVFQSEDHSLVNELKQERTLTLAEIERYGHIVTRCLKGEELTVGVEIKKISLSPLDQVLICSDGMPVKYLQMAESLEQLDIKTDDNCSIISLMFE